MALFVRSEFGAKITTFQIVAMSVFTLIALPACRPEIYTPAEYDDQAPLLTISAPAAGTLATTGLTISGTCEAGLPITISGAGVNSSSNASCDEGNFIAAVTFSATDGTKRIVLSQTDAAGNSGSASRDFIRDTTPPSPATGLGWTASSPTNSTTITATWTPSDAADLASQSVQFYTGVACDTPAGAALSLSSSTASRSYTGSNGVTYSFTVTSTDQVGNAAVSACVGAGMTIDSQAPVITGLSDDAVPTKSKTWTWRCSESCTFRYAIDLNAAWTPTGAFGATASASQNAGTASYYLHVQAQDAAGNLSTVVSASVPLDNSGPSAPGAISGAVVNGGNWWTSTAATPSFSWGTSSDVGSAGLDHYEYAIGSASGGTEVLGWTSNATNTSKQVSSLSLADGSTYYFSVKALDKLANVSSVTTTSWRVDETAPSGPGPVTDGTTSSSTTSSPSISWTTSTDATSGLDYYEVAIGTTNTPGSADTSGWTNVGTGTSTVLTGLNLNSGTTYYASVRARDKAGNVSSPAQGDGWTVSVATSSVDCSTPGSITLPYSGSEVQLSMGVSCSAIRVSMWGAGGGSSFTGSVGGGGAYVSTLVAVVPGETLKVRVGGAGQVPPTAGPGGLGGYPNGGSGGVMDLEDPDPIFGGGGGGGSSQLLRGTTILAEAGGAGGGGRNAPGNPGLAYTSACTGGETPAAGGYEGGGGGGGYCAGFSNDYFAGDGGSSYPSTAGTLVPGSGTFAGNKDLAPCNGTCGNAGQDGLVHVSWDFTATKTTKTATGAAQSFIVPAGVTEIFVKAWGGGGNSGGNDGDGATGNGGGGGFVGTPLAVTPGETLTIKVGKGGSYTGNCMGGGDYGTDYVYAGGGAGGGSSSVLRGATILLEAGGGGGGTDGGDAAAGGGTRACASPGNQIGQNGADAWLEGGGGSGYCAGAPMQGGSSFAPSNASSIAGSGYSQGNASDVDNGGAGAGSTSVANAPNGKIVIFY